MERAFNFPASYLQLLLSLIFLHHLVYTFWIDVCQSNGNLLASGGYDGNVEIVDKREAKIVQTFKGIHNS